jgi:hypothetical protein
LDELDCLAEEVWAEAAFRDIRGNQCGVLHSARPDEIPDGPTAPFLAWLIGATGVEDMLATGLLYAAVP